VCILPFLIASLAVTRKYDRKRLKTEEMFVNWPLGAPNFKTLQSGNLRCLDKSYESPNPKVYENWSINKSLKCTQSFEYPLYRSPKKIFF
jgi:hypothetical protein